MSTDLKEISEAVTHFYRNLYTKDEGIGDAGLLFDSIKIHAATINEHSKEVCDREVALDEIKNNIAKLKNNKAPGNDGLISEFYKTFQDDLVLFLLDVSRKFWMLRKRCPQCLKV